MLEKIEFGVFIPFYTFKVEKEKLSSSFSHIRDMVLECERMGYDSIWLDDHLMFEERPILECWTTLSSLSTMTSRIRLGTMVLSNSFRNPSVLAKMAATLDVISKGRLEFGIGTGIREDEHEAYGIPFPKARIRTKRMQESVEIVKNMWTQEKATYHGKHYRIKDAVCEPKPMQKPHPPITIGGGGERFTLKVTAQHADRYDWGYIPTLELYKHKLDVLESHCKVVARDFNEIEKSCWLGGQIFMVPNQKEIDRRVLQLKPKNVSLRDFKRLNFVASPDLCIRKIKKYKSLGVTYFMLFFGDLPDMNSLRLFAEKVVKEVKTID